MGSIAKNELIKINNSIKTIIELVSRNRKELMFNYLSVYKNYNVRDLKPQDKEKIIFILGDECLLDGHLKDRFYLEENSESLKFLIKCIDDCKKIISEQKEKMNELDSKFNQLLSENPHLLNDFLLNELI